MSKDFQEDRHGLDRDRYKRAQKYLPKFETEDLDLKIKATSPSGEVSEMDIGSIDALVGYAHEITEGSPGDKWIFEIVR
jgi:hypothetical protein